MTDVTDEMVNAAVKAWEDTYEADLQIGECRFADNSHVAIRAALEAALSGTREAVEPVAWYMRLWDDQERDIRSDPQWGSPSVGDITRAEVNGHDIEYLYPPSKAAAPPSDPVGQGAVTVKPLDMSNLLRHAFRSGFEAAANDATQAISDIDHWPHDDPETCAAYHRILSALSPAPEAGSDEVERLRAERERLALAICGGEDAPGYANAQTVETLERVARESHSLHMQTLDEITALREKLGKMREALEPFSEFATVLFERIFVNPDQVCAMPDVEGKVYELKARSFFKARATLANTDKEAGR